jgi:hypothetical protein
MKKFTIETAYSKEIYYCNDIDNFLAEICFCDNYEVISEENPEQEKINLYNETLEKLQKDNIELDQFWNNNVLLLVKGYYETYQEMISNNI